MSWKNTPFQAHEPLHISKYHTGTSTSKRSVHDQSTSGVDPEPVVPVVVGIILVVSSFTTVDPQAHHVVVKLYTQSTISFPATSREIVSYTYVVHDWRSFNVRL